MKHTSVHQDVLGQHALEQFINSATFPIKKVEKIKRCVLVAARVCGEQKLRRVIGVIQKIHPHSDAHVSSPTYVPKTSLEASPLELCFFLSPDIDLLSNEQII